MVYLPPAFTETQPAVLVAHIERYSFGLLVSHGAAGLVASHIPFVVECVGSEVHLLRHLAPEPADRRSWPVRGGAGDFQRSARLYLAELVCGRSERADLELC